MLNVKDVRAGYGNIQIVNGVSITVPDHRIVSIVGANGMGKTTLLKAIVGLLPVMGGEVEFDGKKLNGMTADRIANSGIVLIPAGRQLFGQMTVEENLDVGSWSKQNRVTREHSKEEVYTLFPRLKERAQQLAGSLSGGEQQMVATARALMANPKLLIMDEPSWGLAPLLVNEMFDTIGTLRKRGVSVLLVEQNVYKALQISDWAYVLEHGNVSLQGAGTELLQNCELKKAYLGI